jgi:hypothetical protein
VSVTKTSTDEMVFFKNEIEPDEDELLRAGNHDGLPGTVAQALFRRHINDSCMFDCDTCRCDDECTTCNGLETE